MIARVKACFNAVRLTLHVHQIRVIYQIHNIFFLELYFQDFFCGFQSMFDALPLIELAEHVLIDHSSQSITVISYTFLKIYWILGIFFPKSAQLWHDLGPIGHMCSIAESKFSRAAVQAGPSV